MIEIRFESYSLLYGYSYLWCLAQLFSPYYNWPNFEITKSEHLLSSNKGSKLAKILTKFGQIYRIPTWAPRLAFALHLFFNLVFLFVNHAIQDYVLESIGVSNKNSLTYKVIRYSPFARRVVHIITTMLSDNPSARENLEEWKTLDKSNFFAINYKLQRRYIIFSIIVCLPDIVTSIIDVNWLIFHSSKKYSKVNEFFSNLKPTELFLFRAFFISIHMSNTVIRYVPFITVMYSIICAVKHLNILNNQFGITLDNVTKRTFHNSNKHRSSGSSHASLKAIGTNHVWLRDLEEEKYNKLNSRLKPQKQTRRITYPSIGSNAVSKIETLDSLHDFEAHITKLVLFIREIDFQASLVVYTTCVFNIVTLFYLFFFVKEITKSFPAVNTLMMTMTYIFGRVIPAIVLFIGGSLMKRQANIIIAKQEHLYLEEETQCLIYRQLIGLNSPLMRIFNLLHSIEFNCDNLMQITTSTLIKIILLSVAAGFVVVQYDFLGVLDDHD